MKNGWTIRKLGDVCATIQDGAHESPKKQFDAPGADRFLYITSKNIRTNFVDLSNVSYVERDFHDRIYPRCQPRVGDVLLTKDGANTGNVTLNTIDEPFSLLSSVCLIKTLPAALDAAFLCYYLQSPDGLKSVIGQMTGAAIKRIILRDIKLATIPLPPLGEQQRIVGLLDEAFEGIATAKAHAEKNLQNARALFESHLQSVFSQQGAEWDCVTLQTLLDRRWIEGHLDGNHGGDYPRREEFISEGVPYISANCMDDEGVDMSRAKYLSPDRAALLRKGIAKNNDVLFAHNATVGPVAILHTDENKVILGTSLTYYRCNPDYILPEYLAHYMRSYGFKKQYLQVMGQSTRNQVPITKQREFFHVIPPLAEQKHIITALDGLFENGQRLATLYTRKLAALEELKKSLLHQAFTGQLTRQTSPVGIAFGKPDINLTVLDLTAGFWAISYELHEKAGWPKRFGHVKAEKTSEMLEAFLGFNLDRNPLQDAAGPVDFAQFKRVEDHAREHDYFVFNDSEGKGYTLEKLGGFDALVEKTRAALGDRYQQVDDLLRVLLPMKKREVELFATVYAAWNNLLLDHEEITDERIVWESRENWHEDKLKIPREEFFATLQDLRTKNIIPQGKGKKVVPKPQAD